MNIGGYESRYTTSFFGRRRPVTNQFKEFLESVESATTEDLFLLREAIYEQESRGRFLVHTKFGKIYVGESYGDLVLVLAGAGRDAFLRDIDRTCERARRQDA